MTDPRNVGIIHLHSDYSHDGMDSLESLRERALERGIGFVCLTDHAEDLDEALFRDYLRHCATVSDARVRFIPGLEFRFRGYPGLHLLALDLRRWMTPETPEEFLNRAVDHAGFTVMAHPIYPKYQAPELVLNRIDAIEVWNASYNTRYLPDPRAMRMVRRLRRDRPGLLGVAGLDQHDARNDREVRIILDAGHRGDPIQALRAGHFMNAGRTLRFGPRMRWSPLKMTALSVARLGFDAVERIQHYGGVVLRSRNTERA